MIWLKTQPGWAGLNEKQLPRSKSHALYYSLTCYENSRIWKELLQCASCLQTLLCETKSCSAHCVAAFKRQLQRAALGLQVPAEHCVSRPGQPVSSAWEAAMDGAPLDGAVQSSLPLCFYVSLIKNALKSDEQSLALNLCTTNKAVIVTLLQLCGLCVSTFTLLDAQGLQFSSPCWLFTSRQKHKGRARVSLRIFTHQRLHFLPEFEEFVPINRFSWWHSIKKSACNAGDVTLILVRKISWGKRYALSILAWKIP